MSHPEPERDTHTHRNTSIQTHRAIDRDSQIDRPPNSEISIHTHSDSHMTTTVWKRHIHRIAQKEGRRYSIMWLKTTKGNIRYRKDMYSFNFSLSAKTGFVRFLIFWDIFCQNFNERNLIIVMTLLDDVMRWSEMRRKMRTTKGSNLLCDESSLI